MYQSEPVILDPDTAAVLISAAYIHRRHWILAAVYSADMTHALTDIPTWTAYFQLHPSGSILRLDSGYSVTADALTDIGMMAETVPVAAVVTIPKTVPAARIQRVFDGAPADLTTHDLCFVDGTRDEMLRWPAILLDAIALTDPDMAAHIRTHDPRRPELT